MTVGKCRKDGLNCDGESLVCHLNKDEKNPTYHDLPFWNRVCSNYVKPVET